MRIKKIVSIVLAFTTMMSGLYILKPETKEVQAAETTQSSSNTVEPNEVAEGMLDVKMQTKMNDDGSVSLRLVSSVNGLGYRNVGFEVGLDADGNGVLDGTPNEFIKFTTGNVAKRIDASVTGVTYNYSPKVIDTDAEYFVTCTLEKINAKYLDADMYVRAYCKTMNGQVVYGTGRYFKINDATAAKIVNIPVKMATEPATDENDKITDVVVKIGGTETTATLEKYIDGYAHVNVVVPESLADKRALPSASKVEIGAESAIYRNLETDYAGEGTEDTSWYDEYIENNPSETKFVIATDADLYGLSELAKNNNFVDKTIYVVSDIDVNDGEADSTGFTPDEGAQLYDWTPIGDSDTSFVGTFDGQNHTISGVYFDKSGATWAWGLFGITGDCIVKNLMLENSYLKVDAGSSQVQLGSIAGKSSGTFDTVKVAENVYVEHITSHGSPCTGGIVGQMTGVGDKKISNCWFAGRLEGGTSVGGVLGHASSADNVILENCLNSGDIVFNKNATSVGGLCGEIVYSTLTMRNSLNVGSLDKQTYTATSYGSAIGWIRTNPNADSTQHVAEIYNTYAISENGWNKYAYLSGKGQSSVDGVEYAAGQSIYPKTAYLAYSSLSNEKGYINMNLDFTIENDYEGYWTVTEDTPILSSFLNNESVVGVKEISSPRTAWYVAETYADTDTYTLYTKADMYGFALLSNVSFEGKTVKLGADITMNEGMVSEWEDNSYANLIGWTSRDMAGTFDGEEHTLQGIYLNSELGNVGLFATVSGTVKNLRLQNSYFNCSDKTAGSYESTNYSASIGSIAANLAGGTLDTVYSDAIVNHAGCYAGGLVGSIYTENTVNTITNSCYAGKITGSQGVGGLLGVLVNTTAIIEHCMNVGEVTGGIATGGYCGYVDNRGLKCSPALTLKDCLAVGPLVATDTQTWRGATIGFSRCSTQDYLCAKLVDSYAVASYEDDSNPWVRFASGGTNGAIDVNGTIYKGAVASTSYFWTIQAVRNKVTAGGIEMNLTFYPKNQNSTSDGETKTCWWLDEEGKIPILESFADLLRDITY